MAMTPPRAVIFDMDGTLTRPTLDFDAIHAAVGVPEPMLENMLAMLPGPERTRAFATLERAEIADAGHMMHWTSPDALSALLQRFVTA